MRQDAELLSNQLMEETKFICIHKFYLHYKHHFSSTNFLQFYYILFSLGFLNKFSFHVSSVDKLSYISGGGGGGCCGGRGG